MLLVRSDRWVAFVADLYGWLGGGKQLVAGGRWRCQKGKKVGRRHRGVGHRQPERRVDGKKGAAAREKS